MIPSGQKLVSFNMLLTDEQIAYLDRCAHIRGISRNRLVTILLRVICDDQMTLSVLDDDSRPPPNIRRRRAPRVASPAMTD